MDTKKLETLLHFYETEGLNIIPTKPNHQSRLHWHKWQTRRQTLADILELCSQRPTYPNLAALTGFNNHLVIDCDKPGQFLEFIKTAPTNTLIIKSGRGYHIHYKTLEPIPQGKLIHPLGVEVWGYGHFAQLPNSIHKTGALYTTLINLPILEIPSISSIGAFMPRKEEKSTGRTGAPSLFPRQNKPTLTLCDKIKANITIEDVLGACDFTRSGPEHMLGFCPLHDDNHKSLSYHTQSSRVKCHAAGCQLSHKWHSVIGLYMELHNTNLKNAIHELAGRL